uniref:Uncharacterized protein n=1 Tax=Ascaris lumbricoides TaxID=6252 RepID=A0A9J2P458_ASCLU
MMDSHHVSLNGDAMSTANDYSSRNTKVLNWNSTVENWNECGEEVNRNSGTSSGEESPPSDIPASSSISNAPNIFEAFLRAIDKNELMERPDLETQLKIMNWLCGVDDHRVGISQHASQSVCWQSRKLFDYLRYAKNVEDVPAKQTFAPQKHNALFRAAQKSFTSKESISCNALTTITSACALYTNSALY